MGNLLGRTDLLKKEDLKVEKVEFENGDFIFVREMSGRERDIFEQSLLKKNVDKKGQTIGYEQSLEDFRAKLAVNTTCDDKGALIFQSTDYATLSINMGAKRLEKIVNVAQRLNAITEADKEELVKNSVAGQAGNSSSGSVGK